MKYAFAMLSVITLSTVALGAFPSECAEGHQCRIEVPGTQCGDGKPSYIMLNRRAGARKLLIFMAHGGACWSSTTCRAGFAQSLTRQETKPEWEKGQGIFDGRDAGNPFAREYDVVTIPYCTGDVFTGDKDVNYGTEKRPYVVHHRGYRNVTASIEVIKALYPDPESAVVYGASAGGIGATYHLHNFAAAFPKAKLSVVSDSGIPFKPPYVYGDRLAAILKTWGADATVPDKDLGDFGDVIAFNRSHYPDVRFGLIANYGDLFMAGFAVAMGTPMPFSAVRKTLVDVADNAIGSDAPNAKVFYRESGWHVVSGFPLAQTKARSGTTLSEWLGGLLGERDLRWENLR